MSRRKILVTELTISGSKDVFRFYGPSKIKKTFIDDQEPPLPIAPNSLNDKPLGWTKAALQNLRDCLWS